MVEIKTSFYAKYVKASSDIDSLVRRMLTNPTNVLSHYLSNMNRKEKESLTHDSFSGFSGYSNHFSKCFALNIPSIRDLYIFRILLSNSVFPNGIRPSYKGLRIYFHIPQQLLLSQPWKMWVWPNRASSESYKMRFLE